MHLYIDKEIFCIVVEKTIDMRTFCFSLFCSFIEDDDDAKNIFMSFR